MLESPRPIEGISRQMIGGGQSIQTNVSGWSVWLESSEYHREEWLEHKRGQERTKSKGLQIYLSYSSPTQCETKPDNQWISGVVVVVLVGWGQGIFS